MKTSNPYYLCQHLLLSLLSPQAPSAFPASTLLLRPPHVLAPLPHHQRSAFIPWTGRPAPRGSARRASRPGPLRRTAGRWRAPPAGAILAEGSFGFTLASARPRAPEDGRQLGATRWGNETKKPQTSTKNTEEQLETRSCSRERRDGVKGGRQGSPDSAAPSRPRELPGTLRGHGGR